MMRKFILYSAILGFVIPFIIFLLSELMYPFIYQAHHRIFAMLNWIMLCLWPSVIMVWMMAFKIHLSVFMIFIISATVNSCIYALAGLIFLTIWQKRKVRNQGRSGSTG